MALDLEESEQNTHPDAPERAAGATRRSRCQPCARMGLFQVAHRRLPNGDGICNPCVRLNRHLEDPKEVASASSATSEEAKPEVRKKTKEKVMADELCGRGCGKPPHRGRCGKGSGGGRSKAARSPRPAGSSVKAPRKTNGEVATIHLPVAQLDAWWANLDLDRKARIAAAEILFIK